MRYRATRSPPRDSSYGAADASARSRRRRTQGPARDAATPCVVTASPWALPSAAPTVSHGHAASLVGTGNAGRGAGRKMSRRYVCPSACVRVSQTWPSYHCPECRHPFRAIPRGVSVAACPSCLVVCTAGVFGSSQVGRRCPLPLLPRNRRRQVLGNLRRGGRGGFRHVEDCAATRSLGPPAPSGPRRGRDGHLRPLTRAGARLAGG